MALDGGWGWVVVLSSFMLHVIIDGISYAFGVLAADLVKELGSTRQLNGWIASTMVGVTLAGGPVAGAVSARFGFRAAALAGSVVAAAGFAASYFVDEAWQLIVTVGCLVGFGMSLIYLPAIICVGIYFDKYRSTAIGIAVCGSGVGTLAMSPLISFLLQEYTWRGTMLILSAAVLQCAVFAALFRPLKLGAVPQSPEPADEDKRFNTENDLTQQQLQQPLLPLNAPINRRASADEGCEDVRSLLIPVLAFEHQPQQQKTGSNSPMSKRETHLAQPEQQQQQPQQPDEQQFPVANFLSVQDIRQRVQRPPRTLAAHLTPPQRHVQLSSASLTNVSRPVHFVRSITSLASVSTAAVGAVKASTLASPQKTSWREELRTLCGADLLAQPAFMLFLLSNLLCSIGFNAPYIYTPDRAQRAGHGATRSALLVSVIGGANTAGRLAFGWLSDRANSSGRLRLYWVTLAVSGAAVAATCLSESYAFNAICCAAFGLFSGSFVTLTSPVLVDLVGIDKLSDSFGLTLLFQGVGVLAGPPLAGLLYDWTGSFDVPFLVCGSSLIASGLAMVPVHWLLGPAEQLDHITQEL